MQILLSVLLVFVLAGAAAAAILAAISARYRRHDEAHDLRRFAEEVSVAAERAATTAQRARANWLAAADEVEAAWAAFEEADAETRRLAAAAALPEPATPQTPAEYADRERYLHRAAMAAASRRELPVLQLTDIFANRNGWDPRRHPVEQELLLTRARREVALAAYRAAADRERAAWRDREMAAVAARSLRHEAHAARQAVPLGSWSAPDTVPSPVVAQAAAPLRTAHAG
jgi:hypothetical protein